MFIDKAGGKECNAGTDVRERGRCAVELQGTSKLTPLLILKLHEKLNDIFSWIILYIILFTIGQT